jgi:DNA-binding NtrC family response regulator
MRKRRAIIFDDNVVMMNLLKDFFILRGYEVLTVQEPVVCPVCDGKPDCAGLGSCADIIMTDFSMPALNGIERLSAQAKWGCRVPSRNKILMSGYIDEAKIKIVNDMGCTFFEKPFSFESLSNWLDEREPQMDLAQPLGTMRMDVRKEKNEEVIIETSPETGRVKGHVVNASASGLCLRINAPLQKNQPVTIRTGDQNVARPGWVRWVKGIECGFYLAGLSLLHR